MLNHRFGLLLTSLSGVFVAYPLAQMSDSGEIIVNVIEIVILLTAVVTLPRGRAEVVQLAILALLAILADLANQYVWTRHPVTRVMESVLYSVFFLRITAIILRQVFAPARVTVNEVLGACSVYLVLAIIWAHVFHIVAVLAPGSFQGINVSENEGALQSDLLYFSLTTLTTLGIGDMLPVVRLARMLTALEAVVGQLFLAVLIGRFVGMHIVHSKRD